MRGKFRTVKSGDSYRMDTKKQLIHKCCNCEHTTYMKFTILGRVYIKIQFLDRPFKETKI